ncbi:MAG: hypothetical protein P4N59_25325 [Negativicutes bacterium]|nr:hypothetical protein [Negativicutes bacterium]
MNKLTKYLLFLSAVGAALMIGAYIQQICPNWMGLSEKTQAWLNGSMLNLGSGLICSVLVIALYNRMQDNIREDERQKREVTALTLLRSRLQMMVYSLAAIYKATAPVYSKPPGMSIPDFFDAEYFEQAIMLDLGKTIDPNDPKFSSTWYQSIGKYCLQLSESIDGIIRKYADCLNPDIIEVMERILNAYFPKYVLELPKDFERVSALKLGPQYYPA